jgi:hypothetical protein
MRIALLADIHGNTIALEAVIADIQLFGGAYQFWILGDMAAIGYDPIGVLERLAQLPNACFISGNTEHYLLTGELPHPTPEDVLSEPHLAPALKEVAQSFAWTQGMLTAAGWLPWLAALPLERQTTLPDGTRLLAVHVSPGVVDGEGRFPT